MDRRFAIFLAVIVAIFGVLIATNNKSTDTTSGSSQAVTQHIDNPGKKLTLLEYGDFQCSACKTYYPVIESIREKYKDNLTFQFRNFPLEQPHPNARASARAAEAADKQGKFWEMYNKLYINQNIWGPETNPLPIFTAYAEDLGMNTDQFKTDFGSSEVNSKINADLADATKLKLTSTPTFILNGTKISPNPSATVEAFSELIDKELAK